MLILFSWAARNAAETLMFTQTEQKRPASYSVSADERAFQQTYLTSRRTFEWSREKTLLIEWPSYSRWVLPGLFCLYVLITAGVDSEVLRFG